MAKVMEYADDNSRMEYKTKPSSHFCSVGSLPLANNASSIYTLNELVQGRNKEGKETYAFFLDVQKAYNSVWRDDLWLKLWEFWVRGKTWRVIKRMYESSKSAVLLDGERSVEQGVAQGCSLSPIMFSVFINGLFRDVEEAEIG